MGLRLPCGRSGGDGGRETVNSKLQTPNSKSQIPREASKSQDSNPKMATVSANRLAVQINGRVLEAKDELHRRKLEVLAKFVRALLATPEGKNIAKIILYGSVARGEAEDDSDIDVLVFTLGNDDAMENVAHDVTWETLQAT